jgi:membrane-associated phospholipid phosphatase
MDREPPVTRCTGRPGSPRYHGAPQADQCRPLVRRGHLSATFVTMEVPLVKHSIAQGGGAGIAHRRPHLHPNLPFSAIRLHGRAPWIIPAAGGLFIVLAVVARLDALPWDRPVTNWFVDQRTPALNDVARSITKLGADTTVWPVVALCALFAWPRCRPLALTIVVIALSRPVIVDVAKHLVDRPRPPASVAISHPGGLSFPSGHPFAVAASFGFIPLVLALYTHRRWIWWTSVLAVWSLVLVVGLSRVYLGVHYLTDVVASLLLAIPFVAGSEVVIASLHRRSARTRLACEADAVAGGEPSSRGQPAHDCPQPEDRYAKRTERSDEPMDHDFERDDAVGARGRGLRRRGPK